MGGVLNRSSTETDGTTVNWRKNRREQRQRNFEPDTTFSYDENFNPSIDMAQEYHQWEKNFNQQQPINTRGKRSTHPVRVSPFTFAGLLAMYAIIVLFQWIHLVHRSLTITIKHGPHSRRSISPSTR